MPILTLETRKPYPPKLVTLGRMHVGAVGAMMKLVAFMVHDPKRQDDKGEPVEETTVIIDEDAFLALLAANFPNKELNDLKAPTESSSAQSLPQQLDGGVLRSNIHHLVQTMFRPLVVGKQVRVRKRLHEVPGQVTYEDATIDNLAIDGDAVLFRVKINADGRIREVRLSELEQHATPQEAG